MLPVTLRYPKGGQSGWKRHPLATHRWQTLRLGALLCRRTTPVSMGPLSRAKEAGPGGAGRPYNVCTEKQFLVLSNGDRLACFKTSSLSG